MAKIQSGLHKIKRDKRDYSFHKSFGSVGFDVKSLPENFDVDAGLWVPDQNAMGLPFGCTGFTQTSLCEDEDGVKYDPKDLYDNTPPGGNDGRDIRDSLKLLCSRGPRETNGNFGAKRTAYFNVNAQRPLDWYDATRVALWVNQQEKRSVSIGIPWFVEFESPMTGGVLPIPVFDVKHASWHNAKISGWKTINGIPYLKVKSWQGEQYGDSGWCYMSREIFNACLNIRGTGAFTVSKIAPAQIQPIDWTVVERLVKFIQDLLAGLSAPTTPPEPPKQPQDVSLPSKPTFLWDTPENVQKSLRTVGDSEGLSSLQKDLLCDICYCESRYKVNAKLVNSPKSIDRGLFQWNNYYHPEITDEIAYDPEKATRLACKAILTKRAHVYWSASESCWGNNGKYTSLLS